jgi:hypothetical protein
LPSHLRSEPEEVNVASGATAMGRSGVASRIRAADVRKFPLMLNIILRSTYGLGF